MDKNFSKKPHIVINQSKSRYYLLDANLTEIDSQKQSSLFIIFTRKHKLKKFKAQLKRDLKAYKKKCKFYGSKPDKGFLRMYKDIRFYLSICPDADYNILELLRRNISNLDSRYHNYQAACAEYLRELAKLQDGNPDLLPFDINFATDNNRISSLHKYISNSYFAPFGDFLEIFKDISHKPTDEREEFLRSHAYEPAKVVYNSKYYAEKYVYTPQNRDER
ncbi:MAG: hypothetical protein IKE91_01930 [Clostridia bacterium]|nr:hypothetical protein [Clostridia bacterium]